MNNTEIFTLALGLCSPWFVSETRFESSSICSLSKELHIYIDFKRGSEFAYENNSGLKAYDTVDKTWQHLNFFQHKCYLHARVPRVRLANGEIHLVRVPWARGGSGFTLMFEAFSMLLIEKEMPVSKAAETVSVTAHRLWRVFDYWIGKAVEQDDISSICEVGIDETSSKKGHDYVTVFVDMESRRVVDIEHGKEKDAVKKFVEKLELKGGDRKQVEQVSIDMSPAFISGAFEMFPNAQLTFDKFHIIQHLNMAMDQVRKLERKGNQLIKGHKYTFLKDRNKLTARQEESLDYLLAYYPVLGEAYRLKEMFKDVFQIQDPQEAKGYLKFWCDMANESNIQPCIKFANMIKARWFGIVNYFDTRLTNGILEGINSKIQLLKRRARGYRKISNFINMIHFCCGKLNFHYPLYSS